MRRRNKSKELEDNLKPLRQRLERWRKSGKKRRGRIPEELWMESVEAASKYGVAAVSKCLRLDYPRLKSRVESLCLAVGSEEKAPRFVEVVSPLVRKGSLNAIELQKSGGSRLRLEFEGELTKELSRLSERLWRAAR